MIPWSLTYVCSPPHFYPHLIGIISRTPPGGVINSFIRRIHPFAILVSVKPAPVPSGLVCFFSYPTLQTCLDIDVGQTTERRNVIMKDWYLERVLAYGHMYLLTPPILHTTYKNTIMNLLDTRSTYYLGTYSSIRYRPNLNRNSYWMSYSTNYLTCLTTMRKVREVRFVLDRYYYPALTDRTNLSSLEGPLPSSFRPPRALTMQPPCLP